ncbi:response regulator [Salinispirillum marinum]|uniref:histidine kinase n=2 Tax=Saccharospirillaceae TaxID=255527 RepID=A0ABV8BGY0_9GAMM
MEVRKETIDSPGDGAVAPEFAALTRRQKVLLIDDDKASLTILAELLRPEVDVALARNGEQGLRKAREIRPDLILLDVMMPDMDGFEVIRRLKSDEHTEHIPVMFITGTGDLENEERGLALGACDYVHKPFHHSIVLARVRLHLQVVQQHALEVARESILAKERFLANMSHELRTPLNAIHGTVELLKSQPLDDRTLRQLDTIHQSSRFLLYLINDILDLARLNAGKMHMDEALFDLDHLLQSVCDLYRATNDSKEIDLVIDVAPDVPVYVRGDESRLKQVLANLLSNAYKFTEEGSICIEVRRATDDLLKFAVIDTGIGVAPEKQSTIFDAFIQADDSTARRYGGAGLGLQICTRLVNMMRGRLHVVSEPAAGSTFYFTIPLPADGRPLPELTQRFGILTDPHWRYMAELAARDIVAMQGEVVLLEDIDAVPTSAVTVDRWLVFSRHFDSDHLQRWSLAEHSVLWFLPQSVVYDLPTLPNVALEALPYGRFHLRRWVAADELTASNVTPLPSLNHVQVVVVDDNPVNLRVVTAILEKLGATVQAFDQAQRALDYVKHHNADLMLMDVQMPDLDGLEATERLRQQGFAAPVIAFTANVSQRDRAACLSAGMNDVLVKPVKMVQLHTMVQKWLSPN